MNKDYVPGEEFRPLHVQSNSLQESVNIADKTPLFKDNSREVPYVLPTSFPSAPRKSCLKRPGKANTLVTVPQNAEVKPRISFPGMADKSKSVRPGLLELCAGSATLSYIAEKLGFFAIPVDYSRNKFKPKVPTVKLNLAEDDSVGICMDLISSGSIQVVTAAIPCGTASRARVIFLEGPSHCGPKQNRMV